MQVQILSVEVNNATSKAGKPYEQLMVAYKNLSFNGKVESKTLMPFGLQKDTFTTLKQAKDADVYDVEVVKNEAGYNDWVQAKKGSAPAPGATTSVVQTSASGSTSTKGGWETPAERAAKQIYIIRQSSLSTAVNALTATAKVVPKAEEIIELARQFETYIFESDKAQAVAGKDVGSIPKFDDLEDPLPY